MEKQFIQREKESGFLKDKKKLNIQDIYFLLRKYANEFYTEKTKHLAIGDSEKCYLDGKKDTCFLLIERIDEQIKKRKDDIANYVNTSRPRKKKLEAMQECVYELVNTKLIISSHANEAIKKTLIKKQRKSKNKSGCEFEQSGYCENNSHCKDKSHVENTNDFACMRAL